MTTEVTNTTTGFWYGTGSRVDAVDVLNALRKYRSAESAAQRRAREFSWEATGASWEKLLREEAEH